MFRNSKSLLRSKAGKSKGIIIDVPGKSIEPTPIPILQPSNSQEIGGTMSETNLDAVIVNDESSTIDVVSQAPQDILMDFAPSIPPAKTRSSERRSTMNRTASNVDNVMSKTSGDTTQRGSLQKFPSSPKIILSFTNDSVVESSSSSNNNGVIESQNSRQDSEDAIFQHTNTEEPEVTTEDSIIRTRQRKTTTTSKKRTRSNNDDEQSEDSTVATSSSSKQSKQSKRRKRSSSIASITSSTNTDGSSTKSNSTTSGRKRRSKSRKPRTTTRKQQSSKNRVKPWEDDPEDENPLDDSIVTMAELCKDLKRGRKSNTYKELEYAKYQKSQQKRRQRAAANNIRDDDQEDSEAATSQYFEGEEGNESAQDQNISGNNHQNGQNGQHEGEIEQNETINNEGSENYEEEYYEHGDWEQEGYYDDDGNWIQYENYDENEEYQQDEVEEVEGENTQDDENNENHKPTLMKRRVFSSRGSRFVNADGQYIVREEQNSRPRIYENDEGMEVIEEDKFSHIVNSFTYSKKPRKNERWTIEDTELFFKALSRWGTDFEIISRKIFDNRKSRDQVKNKYKRERKINPLRVYKALDTRIPIEPEELEIISRYTEELANTRVDSNIQDETTEVNQDDIVDGEEGGSTEENQEAFDLI